MKHLLELVGVLNRNKTKSISIIGSGQQTKLDRFYYLLTENKNLTDDEAFPLLYDDEGQRNAYYKLKHQLRERLFNTAFFVDVKQAKFSSRKKAFLECQSLLCLANNLNALRAYSNMAAVCKKVLTISEKFEFTAEHLNAATKLLNYYSIRGKIKESAQMIDLIQRLTSLFLKETHATASWAKITLKYVTDRSPKLEISEEARKYVKEIDNIECDSSSQRLDYLTTSMKMSVHMALGEYTHAVSIIKPVLEKFAEYKFIDASYFHGLAINLIACYIPLKYYQEGEETLLKIYNQVESESFNWFKARELHFILLLHTKRYAQASDLHKNTTTRKKYKKLPGYLQEIWIIYGAYLRILANAGRIELTPEKKANPFRITRYLNSLPTFSKDKRGQNVPVLISQISLLLQQQKLDEVDDRFEAVGKYRSRYAGVEKNFRGNVFLHMLQLIVKNNFDRSRIEKRTAELRALLDTVKIDITSQGYDQEILPYEDLWEIILEAL
ncbi:hypothetical protein [Neolewinella persica]|uniref:hypothetical protein n=1 Tax=Neolewinella persica TaxID=70998 RepID=UPI00037AB7FD|nr:hypothetical protein [Neolewinella persica]